MIAFNKPTLKRPTTTLKDAREFSLSIVMALLIALVLRSFFYESYYIPSGSMKSTLLEGDFLFVAKYPYGFSRHSFPFSPPLFSGRVGVRSLPQRGDIMVFHKEINYIKRLVGLPGDTIEVKDGILFINHTPVPRRLVGQFKDSDGTVLDDYIETLPNQISYHVLDAGPGHKLDNVGPFHVPEGHYFMMGDNRDNSIDSRADIGYVSLEQIVGRADIIFISSKESIFKFWCWFDSLRFERFFKKLPAHA
jgi:signal peptidase I